MNNQLDTKSFLNDDSIVVITDHKRYSVAISYDLVSDDDDPVPRVSAKGDNATFKLINREAEKKGIEQFESPFLACMLYVMTDVGQEIIHDHYWPVAEVLAFVINTGYAQDCRFKKPNPDKYIFRNMGLNIKTATCNYENVRHFNYKNKFG